MRKAKIHRNLRKCVRDYPKQKKHLSVRLRLLMAENGLSYVRVIPSYRGRMPQAEELKRIAELFEVEMSDLLGTTCMETACAEWHTDPDDR